MKRYSRVAEKKLVIAGEATRPVSYAAIPVDYVVLRRDPGDSGTVYVGGPDGYPLGPGDEIRLDDVVLSDVDIYVPSGVTANIYAVFRNEPMTALEIARLAPRRGLIAEYLFEPMGRNSDRLIDTSGRGHHAAVYGGAWTEVDGKAAMFFDYRRGWYASAYVAGINYDSKYIRGPATLETIAAAPYIIARFGNTFCGLGSDVYKMADPFSIAIERDMTKVGLDFYAPGGTSVYMHGSFVGKAVHVVGVWDTVQHKLVNQTNGKPSTVGLGLGPDYKYIPSHGGKPMIFVGYPSQNDCREWGGPVRVALVRLWSRPLSDKEVEVLYDLAKLLVSV